MSKTVDWLPGARTGQLNMAKEWLNAARAKADVWRIPSEAADALAARHAAAEAALGAAQNEITRTHVATAQCREAFDALIAAMRDFKRRYFLTPPLQDSDYVSLSLKPHESKSTPSGPPTAQVVIETFLAGRHELGIKPAYLTGNPHDPANKGFRIWYKLIEEDDRPPEEPSELCKSFFTKRKKDIIEFEYADSGKMVYLAAQIENNGKKGPWGPLICALIP